MRFVLQSSIEREKEREKANIGGEYLLIESWLTS